jgi:Uma2 family endonuclease
MSLAAPERAREENEMRAAIQSKTRMYTFEDFCALIPDGQKADLIDGVIYMASPDNTEANWLFMWLGGLLFDYVEERDLGRVFGTRVAFRLDEYNGPEPDIAFVKKSRLSCVQPGHVRGGPDLAVEIVSPDSIERDYEKKRHLYEAAGVSEYWIIDELDEQVKLLRLGRDGKYREVRANKGMLTSKVVEGFWIRSEWLWQRPLARKLQILKQLLAGAPER